jgi:ADP-L-glycero-D-manno-heptose 6-epimerase
VVNVNLDFLDHPERSGIFNLGSGRAATFNDVATATINACRPRMARRAALARAARVRRASSAISPMPSALAGKYQSYTEADLSRPARRRLRGADASDR